MLSTPVLVASLGICLIYVTATSASAQSVPSVVQSPWELPASRSDGTSVCRRPGGKRQLQRLRRSAFAMTNWRLPAVRRVTRCRRFVPAGVMKLGLLLPRRF